MEAEAALIFRSHESLKNAKVYSQRAGFFPLDRESLIHPIYSHSPGYRYQRSTGAMDDPTCLMKNTQRPASWSILFLQEVNDIPSIVARKTARSDLRI